MHTGTAALDAHTKKVEGKRNGSNEHLRQKPKIGYKEFKVRMKQLVQQLIPGGGVKKEKEMIC